MPRKSPRTASSTYRRRRLTWDDEESRGLNRDHDDDQSKFSELATANQTDSARLVTPSPRGASNRVDNNESPRKRPPRRKQLFSKKKTVRKKSASTAVKSRRRVSKRLSQTDENGGSLSAGSSSVSERKGYKRSSSRKRSLKAGSKDAVSKQNARRTITPGDSLATFFSFQKSVKKSDSSTQKAVKNSDSSTIISTVSKSDCRKESQGQSSTSIAKNNESNNFSKSRPLSQPNAFTKEEKEFELVEKNSIASDDIEYEVSIEKKKKPITPELISLLTSRTKKRSKRTRARSTLEILDAFKRNKKHLQGTRARLPRACKSSTEIIWEEETDEESEPEINDDNDSDWTTSIVPSKRDDLRSEKDSMKEVIATNGSPTKAFTRRRRGRPPKNKFAASTDRNTNSNSTTTKGMVENVRGKTSTPGSQEQESVHSRRKQRRRLDSNDFDASNSGVPPSNPITTYKLLPRQSSQQSPKKTSRKSARQYGAETENSSPRAIVIQESHEESIGVSSKSSSNARFSRRGSRQLRSQSYSKSPKELVSLSNGESRAHESPSRVIQYRNSSPQRKKEQRLLQHRKSDNEVVASKKRVRFDSSTTTFSVKIKIKTNRDASSQDGSNHGQSVPFTPTLDESAVQAIANQVTQACLTQARTSAGASHGGMMGTGDDSAVNVDVDVNEDDESSSNSSSSSEAEEELRNSKRVNEFSHEIFGGRNAPNIDARPEESYLPRNYFDDGRSVTSELTSDWNRPKSSIFNEQDHLEQRRKHKLNPLGKEHIVRGIEKTSFVENGNMSKPNTMRPPRAISKPHRFGETRSQSSVSRRKRIRSCGDSLAGSAFGSVVSTVEEHSSNRIPREVSLQKRSTRLTGLSSPRSKSNKMKHTSSVHTGASRQKMLERKSEREVESIPVIPIVPSPSRKLRIVPFSTTHRCGKCKGCRRTFDCQTCDTCLEKLSSYGSLRSPSAREGINLCLERRCQRATRIGFVDSLLGTKSLANPRQPADHEERINTDSTEKRLSYSNSVNIAMVTKPQDVHDQQESASRTMKAPWEEGDDWTVDYSYLSEPEYRRHWGKATNSNDQKKTSLSTRSLSTPFWRPPVSKKQAIGLFDSGGRTSLSSVSESIVSQNRSKRTIIPMSVSHNQETQGRSRAGKRKRDPLHGIALPRTSTDATSVTSWRENRKCLRALMEYDEADQDWI